MSPDNLHAIAEPGEFQGKPSLTLKWRADSAYPFSFGVTKARLILACLDQIKAFVAAHPQEGTGNRGQGRPAAQRQATAPEPAPGSGATGEIPWPEAQAQPAPTNDNTKPPC